MALISFSGIASGIDSSALIQSLLDQKRKAQITPLETKISELTETNSAFSELKSLLSTLQTAAGRFRSVNGGVIAKSANSSDETKVTASASNSASAGSYDITVISRAKNGTLSFDDRYSSSTDGINSNINNGDPAVDRTVSFTLGSGADQEIVDIELTNTTTLDQFVTEFNSESSNATASVVNVGTTASPSYAIVINSNYEGTAKGSISVAVGARVTDPNNDLNTSDGAFVTNTASAATDAEFSMSGVSGTITRSSNTVSDVLSGITLQLQDLGSATISVTADAASTTAALQDFVDAYNAVVEFINENDLITREEDGEEVTNIFSPLAKTSLDENILSTLRTALSSAGISGGTVNILADLGITTERDGTLKFDSDKFSDALDADAESVRQITENLGEDLSAVDGKIAQFIRFNGLIDLTQTANSNDISNSEKRIADLEALLAREEESLVARFARLEALIGQLNSQQSALASILPK